MRLEELEDRLKALTAPVQISLVLPTTTVKGNIMAAQPVTIGTEIAIPLVTLNAAGKVVPAPSGDVFSASSDNISVMTVSVGVMPTTSPLAGSPALIGMVVGAGTANVTISDSAKLTPDVQAFIASADVVATADSLDLTNMVVTPITPAATAAVAAAAKPITATTTATTATTATATKA